MSLLDEDLIGSFSQRFSVFIREGSIASFDKVMVKSSVGVPWWADGHTGKVQVINWVGGDGGGDGMFLPLFVRLVNKNSGSNETNTHNKKP